MALTLENLRNDTNELKSNIHFICPSLQENLWPRNSFYFFKANKN